MDTSYFYDRWFLKRIHKKPTISKRIIYQEIIRLLDEYLAVEKCGQKTLLDVGCGAGHFISKLIDNGSLKISGADLTNKTIDFLSQKFSQATFHKINYSEPITNPNQYNIITAIEILEHIPHARQPVFIENISKSLLPGGRLLLSTPNLARAHMMPPSFRTTQPVEDWLTIDQLVNLLSPYFEDIQVRTCIWFFPQRIFDILLKRLLYPFHITLEQHLIRNTDLGGHIVISAKPICGFKDEK